MTEKTSRWSRWESGKWRLHLVTGGWVDVFCDLRIRHDADSAVDYQIRGGSLEMPPRFSEVLCIERLNLSVTK